MIRLVALTGRAGAGKTTLAKRLEKELGFTRTSFAAPIRRMLGELGISHDDFTGDKEAPHPLLGGVSLRHAMQTLGTEWGCMCINQDIWSGIWEKEARELVKAGPVVVDDCRFVNEVSSVRALGGVIVRVHNSRVHLPVTHASERGVGVEDFTILNEGSPDDAYAALTKFLTKDQNTA